MDGIPADAQAFQGKNRRDALAPRQDAKNICHQLEMFQTIFDGIMSGIIVTDTEGYISHFNNSYGEFMGLDPRAQIGRHCTDVVKNTRLHIVAKTGIPEINKTMEINGQNVVVQRIPIKKDGKVIAVFGQIMFKNVRDVVRLAERLSVLESKVEFYEKELLSVRSTRYTLNSIIGKSRILCALKREAIKAAANDLPVLITGESGTGKELFAQAIHHASNRRLRPFVRINCAAIPKDLLESEFFGYEKGAFTGANSKGKPGKFELAHQGSFFLDEIGDLPLEMQPKLLRVLEEKEFERVGGNTLIRSDFRLISASNQDLEQMLEESRFRSDLFYRLGVIPLHIPPLRERREDIIPLAEHILKGLAEEAYLPEVRIDPTARDALESYHWPGNVRELCNVMERMLCSLEDPTITLGDLPFYLYQCSEDRPKAQTTQKTLKQVQAFAEKDAIRYALESANYNKARATQILGIHRTQLYKKMKKYGLPLDRPKS